jgi:histidyl-tRNA synthetase
VGDKAEKAGFLIAEKIRNALPTLKFQMHCGGGSFKSQFKKADKSGAEFALILGENEVNNDKIGVKPLRTEKQQQMMTYPEVISLLRELGN